MDWLADILLQPEKLDKVQQVLALSADCGMTPAQFSIAWCLKNPNVSSVILGASKVERLENNLASLNFLDNLDEDLMGEIDIALSSLKELDL